MSQGLHHNPLLNGSIYHMLHEENLNGVFEHRMLLSKALLLKQGITYSSIANENVQGLRDRIFIFDHLTQKYRSLHSYVPFYFVTHTPMLQAMYWRNIQEKIVFLEVSRAIISRPGIVFTDGNASMQQLSQSKGEKVGILPATDKQPTCSRRYKPYGPQGTSQIFSNLYVGENFLDRLD